MRRKTNTRLSVSNSLTEPKGRYEHTYLGAFSFSLCPTNGTKMFTTSKYMSGINPNAGSGKEIHKESRHSVAQLLLKHLHLNPLQLLVRKLISMHCGQAHAGQPCHGWEDGDKRTLGQGGASHTVTQSDTQRLLINTPCLNRCLTDMSVCMCVGWVAKYHLVPGEGFWKATSC